MLYVVMQRFSLFTIEFIICTLIFILFNSLLLIDTALFIVFIISAFFYVFSIEELPRSDLMENPQVHYYKKSRVNYYGNSMFGLLIFLSIIYYLISSRLPTLRLGIVVIILWLIMLILTYLITRFTQQSLFVDIVTDYIVTYSNVNLHKKDIRETVRYLYRKGLNKSQSNKVFSSVYHHIDKKEFEKVRQSYSQYFELTLQPLNSSEIEALNHK
jgi:hypothetical protein